MFTAVGKLTNLFPPASFQNSQRKYRSLMQPNTDRQDHSFLPTLKRWAAHGVPVDCGPDWSWTVIEQAVLRGPHRSALTKDSLQLFHEDIQYQVKAGFSQVVPWSDIQRLRPPHLKVSPVAVVPQKNRRGRIILDLSFPVYPRSTTRRRTQQPLVPSVNDSTKKLAPDTPVRELGNVLWRIFDLMGRATQTDDIHFQKIDLSDGFWRMVVEEDQKWNFCYVLPQKPGAEPKLVVPSALQMGWAESPGFFAATTETVRDLTHVDVRNTKADPQTHPMEHFAEPHTPPRRRHPSLPDLHGEYVYVDDFINCGVENSQGTLLKRIARASLNNIHSIFPPPNVTQHVGGKDPISQKKAIKGDIRWETTKEILGFLLDGVNKTVRIPDEKATTLTDDIRRVLKKGRLQLKRFQQLVGKIRHVAIIMPALRGLFTPINNSLAGTPAFIPLRKNGSVRRAFNDFSVLIRDLASRPTSVHELLQGASDAIGYCDAAGEGAGGVWFSPDLPDPIVWRVPFPLDIQNAIVSDSNPDGTITNSDLELAGVVLHIAVLATVTNLYHRRSGVLSDNSAAVYWARRMASRSQTNISGSLLRGLAMMLRTLHAGPLTVAHTEGRTNLMADLASRSFSSLSHPSNPQFLALFRNKFPLPLPQHHWILRSPPPQLTRQVMSTLRGDRSTVRSWTNATVNAFGPTGSRSFQNSTSPSTATFATSPKHAVWTSSSLLLSPSGEETTAVDVESKLEPLRKRYASYVKPSNWLDSLTPDDPTVDLHSHSPSGGSSRRGATTMHQPNSN